MSDDFSSVFAAARIAQREERWTAADMLFRRAVSLDPENAPAAKGLAETQAALGRTEEAIALFRQGHARWPTDTSFLYGLADIYQHLGQGLDAVEALIRALNIDPSPAMTHLRVAMLLRQEQYPSKALAAARRALARDPSSIPALGFAFGLQLEMCDWHGYAEMADALTRVAPTSDGSINPFLTLNVPGVGLFEQQAVARAHAARLNSSAGACGARLPSANQASRRIRLGYVSGDFNDHPVGRHMIGILENHDRSQFEVFAYSLQADDGTPLGARFRAAVEHWREATGGSPAAKLIDDDNLDILVNLGGYTRGADDKLAVCRVAPIQVSYLGYSATTGSQVMDYILTDPVVSPPDHAAFYSETFAYLPTTLFNIAHEDEPAKDVTRAECGLPDDAFVFCCFCNNTKINPIVFDVWMRLLHAVPGSVLWLRKFNPFMMENLRKEAAARGIASDRLVFASKLDRERHLARHACADLFLDTQPYAAGSTAADALWVGVPLVTCTGDTYVSRMGASIVRAVGLGELVADDLEGYYQTALRLAQNPSALNEVRERLLSNRRASILFDSSRFTRQIEKVYREMYDRHTTNSGVAEIGRLRF
jgi:predicted O-linked N-acetylglucosamine transferase (SPINDLY family)